MAGIVACGHSETARVAAQILEDGGNAFDAALAGVAAACFAEPVLASLGGGGYLLAAPARGRLAGQTLVYDFFVQTPRARRNEADTDFRPLAADFGPVEQEFHVGMGSIATPGVVAGLFAVHGDLGFMPLRRLLEPAIELGRTGVVVDAMMARLLRVVERIITSTPESRALFSDPADPGRILGQGGVLRVPELADILELLAIEGADLFYRGELARLLAEDCESGGGHLTLADLAAYRVERRHPLTTAAFAGRVHLNPPPAVGGVVIGLALALLKNDWQGAPSFGSPSHLHPLARALVRARQATADAEFGQKIATSLPMTELPSALVDRARDSVPAGPLSRRGTTHISVIDGAGSVASVSLSNGEGSGYVLPGTGIILNNILGEEALNPEGFHRWPRDARLGSLMCPTLVEGADGSRMTLGSGGSNRIPSAILQVLLNVLVFGQSPDAAVASPRIHCEGGRLSLEPGFPQASTATLAADFPHIHQWEEPSMFFGGVHLAVRAGDGRLAAAADFRRGGAIRTISPPSY